MAPLLTHYWHILSNRFDQSGEQRFLREARRAMGACDAPRPVSPGNDEASRTERLRYIALFAQAGYFNMGHAVDLCQPPVDLPPF